MSAQNLEEVFTYLFHNYCVDEVKSAGMNPKAREAILGDYEVALAKIEEAIGKERFDAMKKEFPRLKEKYNIRKDEEYARKPGDVFETMLDVLKEENERLNTNEKKDFVEELGKLMAKYNVQDITGMTLDENGQTIEVTFLSGKKKEINVAFDSEWAIIKDLGNQLEYNPYIEEKEEDTEIELC